MHKFVTIRLSIANEKNNYVGLLQIALPHSGLPDLLNELNKDGVNVQSYELTNQFNDESSSTLDHATQSLCRIIKTVDV